MAEENKLNSILSKNNSDNLLQEENDIDYGKNRPSLVKYYIIGSLKWIMSYWYITLPAIFIGLFIFGTAAFQYIQGNDKPVWGMRTDNLTSPKKLSEAAKSLTEKEKSNYKHFRVYVSGPEIHIGIGMNSDAVNYDEAQNLVKETYNKLIDSVPGDKDKIRHQYSVTAIVSGSNPESDSNLHAFKPKIKDDFNFYHKD